jgi:hypothetical protein
MYPKAFPIEVIKILNLSRKVFPSSKTPSFLISLARASALL